MPQTSQKQLAYIRQWQVDNRDHYNEYMRTYMRETRRRNDWGRTLVDELINSGATKEDLIAKLAELDKKRLADGVSEKEVEKIAYLIEELESRIWPVEQDSSNN